MKAFTISSPKFNPITVDFDAMPEVSKDYIIQRGFDHLNDVHAGIHLRAGTTFEGGEFKPTYATQDEVNLAALKAITDKVGALLSGVVSVRRASAEPIDPVAKRILENARVVISNALAAKSLSKAKIGAEKFGELVQDYITKNHDKLTATAKAELKRESELSIEVDLSSLGI